MNTSELLAILQKKYGPPEYTFLTEVRNGTGFARSPRTADALAFNLWPSRGMELYGFELKASRSDWKRELADPEKAEAIAPYCDRWWIVAGDSKIVEPSELPKTWGLQVATDKGLKVIKEAPHNENPKQLDRYFLWAVLRSYGAPATSVIEEARREGFNRGVKTSQQQLKQERERKDDRYEDLKRQVQIFEEKSGLTLSSWHYGNASEVAQFLKDGGIDGIRRDLADLQKKSSHIAEVIETTLTRGLEGA